MKPEKSQSLPESFKYALAGIRYAIIHERNFKIHIVCVIIAAILCVILPIDGIHSFMVMYAIFFVLCMELINTAVEALVDLFCGQKMNPLAKIAKDCCAGAVLLSSIQAVIVGVIVVRHLLSL